MKWELVSEEPVIPLGKEGEWDSGMISTANQPTKLENNRLFIFYSGANFTHGRGEQDMDYQHSDRCCIGVCEIELLG
ncbi:MAG: hypothetical protein RML10_09755 [Geminocystis sp.]|nr:hypothetical protein [Geminocystis sp.]